MASACHIAPPVRAAVQDLVSSYCTCRLCASSYGCLLPPPGEHPDWLCEKRELPSEKFKLSCPDLAARTDLHSRACWDLNNERACNSAYHVQSSTYSPCMWNNAANSCESNGQGLECDCELKRINCPVRPTASASQQAAATASNTPGAAVFVRGGGLTQLEMLIIYAAITIIICSCGGAMW